MNEQKMKELFVKTYELDMKPEEIESNQVLFGPESSFGLDSIDVLRFISALKDEYQLQLGSIRTDTFKNIEAITQFVEKQS
ncbi:acyl carrier protein [Paludifilum halophilum]|uniref:Acyl carrier protein n=1 Tax=Paludifilum halophilum TaxID=1642702 RepID=A0A235BCE5_9BACL|nr:phosphopantetheine-binding protein [Paludifilum halophilum]OYD09617.1 acyl carrier protein [Paludifilum halophilum]